MAKIEARKLSGDAEELIRKRAVILVKEGKKEREVCEIVGVSRVALYTWKKAYKQEVVRSLKKKKTRSADLKWNAKGVVSELCTSVDSADVWNGAVGFIRESTAQKEEAVFIG